MTASDPARRTRWLCAALLVVATGLVYAPVAGFAFVSYDDPPYVSANPHVRAGLTAEGLRWALGAFHSSNWHPLTWLSHMLDVELFGLDAGRHHLVSVALHALGSVLCLLALCRLGVALWPAFAAAGLFALHPLHVESVAWIAERKDVLSGVCFFGCLWLYAGHARGRARAWPWSVAACFALGLMAKPMLVTLPVVLLLLDRWPLARWPARSVRALLLEKAPLFALAGASAALTLLAQGRGGAIQPFERLPLDVRLAHAPLAILGYLRRFLWPSGLACYYPHPALEGPVANGPWGAAALGAAFGVLALTALVLVARHRSAAPAIGWLWMLVMLLPVLGIVQVGGQALADRYTYLPTVGLSLALAVPLAAALPPRVFAGGVLLVLLVLGALAHRQVGFWRDTITLFQRALAVTGANHVAATNLGSALAEAGRLAEAEPHLLRALQLAPLDPRPATSYASLLAARGDLAGARSAFAQALRAAPAFVPALRGLTGTSAALGESEAALEAGERWLRAAPLDPEAHYELALLRDARGERAAALQHYRAALERAPELLEAGLAFAWLVATTPATAAEAREALTWAQRAVDASGGRDADALDVLAASLAASGDFRAAEAAQERALAIGGDEGREQRSAWLERYRAGLSLAPAAQAQPGLQGAQER